jgi:hypothetical protein
MASHALAPIPLVARYFDAPAATPIVTGEFSPASGWRTTDYRKRISRAWARHLKVSGVTHVRLTWAGRDADFSIAELLRD